MLIERPHERRWHGELIIDKPCPVCGTQWTWASDERCAECARRKRIEVQAPLDPATILAVRHVATEICRDEQAVDPYISILLCSLFAGARSVKIAKSLGLRPANVLNIGRRLFAGKVWDWKARVVHKSAEKMWLREDYGNVPIILDSMVGAGLITRNIAGEGEPRYFAQRV